MSELADVTVISPQDVDRSYFSPKVKVLGLFDFSANTKPSVLRKLLNVKKLKVLQKIKPDIIHITDFQPIIAFGLYLYGLNRVFPLVYTDHDVFTGSHSDSLTAKLNESWSSFLNRSLLNYKMFIVHGDFLKNCMINKGIPSNKIGVIPHGSYTLFSSFPSDKKTAEEKDTILFFGYIRKYKGLEYLIRATTLIQKQIPDIKLIIAGEGKLQGYFEGKPVPPNFELHNQLIPDKDVKELFSRAQLLVLPYIEASQSGPLHIALATGKPVVATNVGSIPDVVKDGKNGFLVKPKDEDALATAVIRILKDTNLRQEMGNNAYEMATRELSWDNIAKKTLDLYNEVLKGI